MQHTWVPVASIVVHEWRKRDLGDLEPLKKSIDRYGLMDALVLTKANVLVSGWRRLAAVQALGRKSVEAYRVDDILKAVKLIEKEGTNPEFYKEMTWSEKVGLGLCLEEMDDDYNKKNMSNARRKAASTRFGGNYNAIQGRRAPTTEIVAKLLGTTRGLYGAARRIVVAARREDAQLDDLKIVQQAVQYMDETNQPYGALAMIRGEARYLPSAQDKITLTELRSLFEGASAVVDGLAHGLRQVKSIPSTVPKEEASRWLTDLFRARREMERVINLLRRYVNDG